MCSSLSLAPRRARGSGVQRATSRIGRGAERKSAGARTRQSQRAARGEPGQQLGAKEPTGNGECTAPEASERKCWRCEPGVAWVVTPLRTVVSVVLSHYPASRA